MSDEPVCSLCGRILIKCEAPLEENIASHDFSNQIQSAEAKTQAAGTRVMGLPSSVLLLMIGAALAPVFTFTPLLKYMGWFIKSLAHEMGHSLAGWFFGCPAFPAIRLDGHAAAFHQGQIFILAFCVMAALCYSVFHFRSNRKLMIVLAVCTLAYPAIAFTRTMDLFHLFAGHLGELALAVICIWRAMSGGFSSSMIERGVYSVLGWYLASANAVLCGKLLWSQAARSDYASSGSFGLTNDYIIIAENYFNTSVQSIAVIMLIISLLAIPLGVLLQRFYPGD